ncbi:MAG: Mrp/NBP35 family ATP-binding protein [Planctomycetota bacterium]
MSTDLDAIRVAVSKFKDPETGRTIGSTNQLKSLDFLGETLVCNIELASHSFPVQDEFKSRVEECIRTSGAGSEKVEVEISEFDRPPARLGQIGLTVKSVIAVGSGKGGVGKSTMATSIALTLSEMGCKVGLMDADVYGPSVPHLLGLEGMPEVQNGKIHPIFFEHIPVMSMGFMLEEDQAVIWRGPKLHGAITQFLRDTYWGPLDYLIIDMPPGTGDVALTLSQALPVTGSVVVCTPQKVALLDATKAIGMFGTTNIPVLGMIENMSGFICPDNGKRYDIFGAGGARAKAEEKGVAFLGEVPLNMQLRLESDEGNLASVLKDPICRPALEKIVRSMCTRINDRAAASPNGPGLPVL